MTSDSMQFLIFMKILEIVMEAMKAATLETREKEKAPAQIISIMVFSMIRVKRKTKSKSTKGRKRDSTSIINKRNLKSVQILKI